MVWGWYPSIFSAKKEIWGVYNSILDHTNQPELASISNPQVLVESKLGFHEILHWKLAENAWYKTNLYKYSKNTWKNRFNNVFSFLNSWG